MPLFGTLDVKPLLADAPLLERLDTEPWTLPGAEVLHVLHEIDAAAMQTLLPPALHPTIPPTSHLVVTRVPESPVGPFVLAQARVGCRAGAFQRGLVTRAFCDSPRAASELRQRFGFDVRPARVRLSSHYDRVEAEVALDGRRILGCGLVDPLAIGQGDVRYVDVLNLARVVRDGEERARLVQLDAVYSVLRADRGRPVLQAFDAAAWRADGLLPRWAVSGSFCRVDLTLPRPRYLVDPLRPAFQATERI